jgi:hypothetical protein
VDIGDEKTIVRAYPTNFLPSTPSGKLQNVVELVKGGFYTQEEARELLDFPDLQKINNIKSAQREDILKVIEKMIDTEKYISPEPYMNLDLAKDLAQSYYLRCKCDDAPEEVLDLLRLFMADVKEELAKLNAIPVQVNQVPMDQSQIAAPQDQQQIPQELMNAPTGVPTAPPQSDLIPNNPTLG